MHKPTNRLYRVILARNTITENSSKFILVMPGIIVTASTGIGRGMGAAITANRPGQPYLSIIFLALIMLGSPTYFLMYSEAKNPRA